MDNMRNDLVLGTPAARTMTAAFIGQPIGDALLADIRDRLSAYYNSIGRPFVEIAIPAQDVGDGTLQVNVIEMKRGHIRVGGNRWFDDQQYIGAISIGPGDPIDTERLTADAAWINREEHRHATVTVEPGDDASTCDLIPTALGADPPGNQGQWSSAGLVGRPRAERDPYRRKLTHEEWGQLPSVWVTAC